MGVQFNRGAFERALNGKMASAVQVQADKLQRVYDRVWAAKGREDRRTDNRTAPAGVARGVRPRDPRGTAYESRYRHHRGTPDKGRN
jgi:hypothetical protein